MVKPIQNQTYRLLNLEAVNEVYRQLTDHYVGCLATHDDQDDANADVP